jgi:hypothetical protein
LLFYFAVIFILILLGKMVRIKFLAFGVLPVAFGGILIGGEIGETAEILCNFVNVEH